MDQIRQPKRKTSSPLLVLLSLAIGLNMSVSAQVAPGDLYGKATIGANPTLVNGNITNKSTGELYLGADIPAGSKINQLTLTGNYVGESGSKVYPSVTSNTYTPGSAGTGINGYLKISGIAKKSGGSTTVVFNTGDLLPSWNGTCIDLAEAANTGSDADAFTMAPTKATTSGLVASLLSRTSGALRIWYIANEPKISAQSTAAQSTCLGGSVFNALSVTVQQMDGSAPVSGAFTYQWYRNTANNNTEGTTISGASGTVPTTGIVSYTPANTTAGTTYYYCVITSAKSTCTTIADTSAVSGAIVVTPSVVPSVSIVANLGTTVCSNTSVTFTATPTNGGTPSYQWKKGGVNISGATAATYTYTPANGDKITCVMTSNATCAIPATTTSNELTMTVSATCAGTITTSCETVCEGAGSFTCTLSSYTGTITKWQYAFGPSYTAWVDINETTENLVIENLPQTAQIRAIVNGVNIANPVTITTQPKPVVSFTGATSICVGSTTTLSPATGGTWVSNNTSVATVTDAGVVTGVGQGSVTFTYTRGGCSSSITIP